MRSVSRCTASGEPIVRSSHMYVGQEVQAVTIRRQVQPNLCMQPTAICFRRSALRAPIPLSPSAPPCRPPMPRLILSLGTRSPPLGSYRVQCAQREPLAQVSDRPVRRTIHVLSETDCLRLGCKVNATTARALVSAQRSINSCRGRLAVESLP
jgi:hypothetical protein